MLPSPEPYEVYMVTRERMTCPSSPSRKAHLLSCDWIPSDSKPCSSHSYACFSLHFPSFLVLCFHRVVYILMKRKNNIIFSSVAKSCPTLATPWTIALQAPLPMGFSRQEQWSGSPFRSPGDVPNPGIEPGSPALQADSLPTELQGKNNVIGR